MSKQTLRNAVGRTLPSVITIVVVGLMLAGFRAWAMPAVDPASTNAIAGVVSYQGYLTDASGEPVSGDVEITFRLYTVVAGGTAVWTEEHTGGNAVPVGNGLFNVMLGSLVPIPASVWSNANLYLGVQAGSDPEMAPREPVGMVPYALLAQRAQQATELSAPDGDPADALTVTDNGWLTSGSGLISVAGNLGLGTTDPQLRLDVWGNAHFRDNVGIGTTDPQAPLDVAGRTIHRDRVGIGTTDPLARLHVWGNSLFRDRVGIGKTDPQVSLDVVGDIDWTGQLRGFNTSPYSSSGSDPTYCGPVTDRVCFLRRVEFTDGPGDVEWRRCRVVEENGSWWLYQESTGGAGVSCGATCLIW